jgi:Protein of unknown function (DUF1279)
VSRKEEVERREGRRRATKNTSPTPIQTLSTLTGCYLAIKRGVNVDGILHDFGLKRVPDAGEADAKTDEDEPSWTRWLTGGGSTLALAFVANKALFPVRAPITITLTPAVARFLRSRAGASVGSVRREG